MREKTCTSAYLEKERERDDRRIISSGNGASFETLCHDYTQPREREYTRERAFITLMIFRIGDSLARSRSAFTSESKKKRSLG